jgi:NADH dehydrogenase FAD-containing subunit
MSGTLYVRIAILAAMVGACAAQDVVTAVKGTVTKVDAAGKTVTVKAADGTEHMVHVVDRTVVHGAENATKDVTKETYYGLRKGSKVVLHYSKRGTEETAEELDDIGKGGLKAAEGTVTKIDRDAKTITVKTAKGAEETYRIADHASVDAGKDIGQGAEKAGKVTVYYTDQAGRKVAHFFEKAF